MARFNFRQPRGTRAPFDPNAKLQLNEKTVPLKNADNSKPGAIDGKIVSHTFGTANVMTTVTHNLGRIPVGLMATSIRKATGSSFAVQPVVHFGTAAANTTQTMTVYCTGTSAVTKLLVW